MNYIINDQGLEYEDYEPVARWCQECDTPNQFGELCEKCRSSEEDRA